MPDFKTNPTSGNLEDSAELIRTCIYEWLDPLIGSDVPLPIIRDPGDLLVALETGKSAVIAYDHSYQLWAHIRSAISRHAVKRWASGHWKLRFKAMDPTTLVGTLLSNDGPWLVNLPLLIILAPEWPRNTQGMEHANYLLRQREGMKLPTFFCTRDLSSIVDRAHVEWTEKGGLVKSRPTVNPEFRQFLVEDTDVLKVTLQRGQFKAEIKSYNGGKPEDVL